MLSPGETVPQNFTGITVSPLSLSQALPVVIVIEVLVVAGNLVVICGISRCPTLRNRHNAFVINLAAADLLYGTAGGLSMLLTLWNSSELLFRASPICSFILTVTTTSVVSSSLSLLGASIGRLIPLLYPLRCASIMTSGRVAIIITCCWAASLLIAVSPLIVSWNPGILEMCGGSFSLAFAFLICNITFVVSASGNIAIYVVIYVIARKHSRAIQMIAQVSEQNKRFTKEIVTGSKASRVLVAAVVCSLVFCVPLLAAQCTLLFSPNVTNLWIVNSGVVFYIPAFSSAACAINPWIYSLRTKEMRRILFRSFNRVMESIRCGKRSNTVEPN